MAEVTINLKSTITTHKGDFNQIVLREPKHTDVRKLGEPMTFAYDKSGMVYSAVNEEVLDSYIQRLLVTPSDPLLLEQMSLVDSLQVREAVLDFFGTARKDLQK